MVHLNIQRIFNFLVREYRRPNQQYRRNINEGDGKHGG